MNDELKALMAGDIMLLEEIVRSTLSEPKIRLVPSSGPKWETNLKDIFMKTLLNFDERELINLKPSDLKKLRKTVGRLPNFGRTALNGDSQDIEVIDFVATETGVRLALIDVHSMNCTIFGGVQPFKTYISAEIATDSPKWSLTRKEIPFIILKQEGIEWRTNSTDRKMKTSTQFYHVTNDQLLTLGRKKKYTNLLYFLNKIQFIRCQALETNGFEIGDWKKDFDWTFDQSEVKNQRIQRLLTANIS